jgi:hypothetical protein
VDHNAIAAERPITARLAAWQFEIERFGSWQLALGR